MATIEDIRPSITEMTFEESSGVIADIRNQRIEAIISSTTKKKKKKSSSPKKTTKRKTAPDPSEMTVEQARKLYDLLSKEQSK